MFLTKPYRNSQKRFYGRDKIYFITTVTYKRFPFFKEDLFCELFAENLRLCKKIKDFKLYAFTIILDHIHLLIKPGKNFNISQIMQFLKRHFSRDINFILNSNNEGEIRESRLQGGDYENFSEIIKSHDQKLKQIKNQFISKYDNLQFDIPEFRWQQSFRDHVIRNEKDFLEHLNYIIFNCIKHGIYNDEMTYKWSGINPEFADFVDDWFA